jgi:hypothetical protein
LIETGNGQLPIYNHNEKEPVSADHNSQLNLKNNKFKNILGDENKSVTHLKANYVWIIFENLFDDSVTPSTPIKGFHWATNKIVIMFS